MTLLDSDPSEKAGSIRDVPEREGAEHSRPNEAEVDTLTELNKADDAHTSSSAHPVSERSFEPKRKAGTRILERFQMARVVSVLAVFAFILIAVLIALQVKPSSEASIPQGRSLEKSAVRVGATPVRLLSAPELTSSYRGIVIPRRESDLAFRRSGRIDSLLVEAGDSLRRGELLGTLDVSDLNAQLKVAESELAVAEAQYEEALAGPRSQTILAARARVAQLTAQELASTKRLERKKQLRQANAASVEELEDEVYAVARLKASTDEAKSQLDELLEGTRSEQLQASKSRVDAAKAAIELIRVQLADSQLHAPFDCVIARRLLDEGTIASSSVSVFSVLEEPPLEAQFGLPSGVARMLAVGDSLGVSIGLSDQPPKAVREVARVVRIEPRVDPSTRTREVVVEFESKDTSQVGEPATLWVPWSARGRTHLGDAKEFWVPSGALVRNVRGLWGIYVLKGSSTQMTNRTARDAEITGTVVMRDAKVIRTAGTQSLVEVKLSDDETVITQGIHRVGPGTEVVALLGQQSKTFAAKSSSGEINDAQ